MKITVYTTTDCQFSKQEREYLTNHNLTYEEKNLETNKDFLTEMLAVSTNFAGTPVTRVEKDDGTIAVLKGFTPAEFDTTFGFTSETPKTEETKLTEPTSTEVKPSEEPVKPVEATPAETPTAPPPAQITPTPADEKLNSVLDKLEEKTETPPTTPPPTSSPSVPDFPTGDTKVTA